MVPVGDMVIIMISNRNSHIQVLAHFPNWGEMWHVTVRMNVSRCYIYGMAVTAHCVIFTSFAVSL